MFCESETDVRRQNQFNKVPRTARLETQSFTLTSLAFINRLKVATLPSVPIPVSELSSLERTVNGAPANGTPKSRSTATHPPRVAATLENRPFPREHQIMPK